MTNTTRKRFLPVALVMAIVAIGVVALSIALVGAPRDVQAHGDTPGSCDTDAGRAIHDLVSPNDPCPAPTMETPTPAPSSMHASMPQSFQAEGLDNSARLSWGKPRDVHAGGDVVGYRIDRDAWHPNASHPVNQFGDTYFHVHPGNVLAVSHTDRGLAYDTAYVYRVRALVRYSSDSANFTAAVTEWWNSLDCPRMNDVVEDHVGSGPAVGPDNASSPYCAMYSGLTGAAKEAVNRSYTAMGYNMGTQSDARAIQTAVSGGLLDALLAPPSAPQNLGADSSCDDSITVRWQEPADRGKAAADFPGCSTCNNQTPPHHGGTHAGIVVLPGEAFIVSYTVERKVGDGVWAVVTITDGSARSYVDTSGLTFGTTYHYRVRATNNANLTGPPAMVTEALSTPPAAQVPTSPDADPNPDDSTEVLFTWDPPGTAAGTAMWRVPSDVGAGNLSKTMSYQVQRQRVGTTTWQTLIAAQPHQYLESAPNAAEAISNIQTQEFVDENVPDSGSYKYRVRARLYNCQPSEWAVTAEEVTVVLSLGDASGLTATAGSVPGVVNLNWTAAPNANIHWLAGIKQSDLSAGNYSNLIWMQTSSANAQMVAGLDSGAEYVFAVIGGGSVNGPWSSWTALVRVTTN